MTDVGTNQSDGRLQMLTSNPRSDDLRMGTPVAQPQRVPVSSKSATKVSVLDNALRVKTPENISFEYRLAGPCRRIIAYSLDVIITIAAFTTLSIIVYLICLFLLIPLAQMMGIGTFFEAVMGVVVGLTLILYFIVYWFYGAWMEANCNGQTLGKRLTGMRVLSADGHSIDGVQATLRNFFRLLDIFPVVTFSTLFDFQDPDLISASQYIRVPTFLFGLIMMTLSPKFQRVGDLVAGTVVVNEENERLTLGALSGFTDPRVPQLAELIPNYFVAPNSLANAIASYIERRQFMAPQRASEIAAHVAPILLQEFRLPSDTNHDLFLCSLYYKIFFASGEIEGRSNFQPSNGRIENLTQARIDRVGSEPIGNERDEQSPVSFGQSQSWGQGQRSGSNANLHPNPDSIKEGKE